MSVERTPLGPRFRGDDASLRKLSPISVILSSNAAMDGLASGRLAFKILHARCSATSRCARCLTFATAYFALFE